MSETLLEIVIRSIFVSGIATMIGLAIGIPVGAALGLWKLQRKRATHGRRGRLLLLALVNTGMGLPPVVVGVFIAITLSRSGPLGFFELLYSVPAIIIAQVVLSAPLSAGITYATVASLPERFILQLRAFGANGRQVFRELLWESRLGILAAAAVGFGQVISEVGAVTIVGGNIEGSTRVMTTAIVLEARKGEFIAALGLGLVLLALVFGANLLVARFQESRR